MLKKSRSNNIRQYFIKAVFLASRSRRVHIDSIHTFFAIDSLKGLCSYNQLNMYVLAIVAFVYGHLALMVWSIAGSLSKQDK